jgi:hypothetical protein
MVKKVKKVKIKHYFTLDEDVNNIFMNHININIIDKQKLIEKLIKDYINNNKII